MLRKSKHYILMIILVVCCSSAFAQTDTLPPPVPENELSCEKEVAHIFITDQYDRTDYMLDTANFDIDVFNRRDSMRLSRIIELDSSGCITDYESLRKAAFVYLHSGGVNMPDDSIYYKRSMELADMAAEKAGDSLERMKANSTRQLASNKYNKYLREKGTAELMRKQIQAIIYSAKKKAKEMEKQKAKEENPD